LFGGLDAVGCECTLQVASRCDCFIASISERTVV
jgi:hypothetical protein